jgi:hypothetical protein
MLEGGKNSMEIKKVEHSLSINMKRGGAYRVRGRVRLRLGSLSRRGEEGGREGGREGREQSPSISLQ